MSGLRFRVGEIAINNFDPVSPRWQAYLRKGDEVEIVRVGPFAEGEPVTGKVPPWCGCRSGRPEDYECCTCDGIHFFCRDSGLLKRPQPGIPEEVRAWFSVDVPARQGEKS